MSKNVAVTSLGMVSSLGNDVRTSCAAAGAGIVRSKQLNFAVLDEESGEMEPVIGHTLDRIVGGFEGFGRLKGLGVAALEDLLGNAKLGKDHINRTGFFLHLSDAYYDEVYFNLNENGNSNSTSEDLSIFNEEKIQFKSRIQETLIPEILELNGINISTQFHRYSFGGVCEFVELLSSAIKEIEDGKMDRCIIGGVDSLVESYTIERLQALGILQTVEKADGFKPGEGAAFVLLENSNKAKTRNTKAKVRIHSLATSKESFHRFSRESPQGKALFDSIYASNLGYTGSDLFEYIGSLNGDSCRAKDFGCALNLLSSAGCPTDFASWFPAMAFGEIGAAAGPISICLGVRKLLKQFSSRRDILVWLYSDDGGRGSFLLSNSFD